MTLCFKGEQIDLNSIFAFHTVFHPLSRPDIYIHLIASDGRLTHSTKYSTAASNEEEWDEEELLEKDTMS